MSDALTSLIEKADAVWDRFQVHGAGYTLAAFVGGLVSGAIRFGALGLYNTKNKRRAELYASEGEDEEENYHRPTTVVWPEQEEVVFWKQMIALCDRLPEDERAVAALVFDRATASEIAMELGVTPRELSRRLTAAARRLEQTTRA